MQGDSEPCAAYVIPARTLTGSPEQVVEQIDQMVRSLLAFRQVVASAECARVRPVPPQNGSRPTAR